jgi:hypothetical protein
MNDVITLFKIIIKMVAYSIGIFILGIFGIIALIVYVIDQINIAILD